LAFVLVLAADLVVVVERHLQLVLVRADARVAGVVGDVALVHDLVRIAVRDEHDEVRRRLARAWQEVARHAEAVLPVRAPVGVEGLDIRLERARDRRVRDREVVVPDRQGRDGRELCDCEPRAGVRERPGERPERVLHLVRRPGVGDRSGLVEDDQDVDPARGGEVGIRDRVVVLVGRGARRLRRDDDEQGHEQRQGEERRAPRSTAPPGGVDVRVHVRTGACSFQSVAITLGRRFSFARNVTAPQLLGTVSRSG
jgi:hypothetical protein